MDFFEMFGNISKEQNEREEAFRKLQAEPPKLIKKGDKVLIAAGLLGMGFLWIREEAVIIDVQESAVKAKFKDYWPGQPNEKWIDPILVTDILERATADVMPE